MVLVERDAVEVEVDDAASLLVDADSFAAATGWVRKPEGFCRGPVCLPAATADFAHADGRIDVPAFAERLGLSLVVDDEHGVAALAGDPMGRGQHAHLSELTLPDLDGGQIDFGEFVGRKTLLVAWASW